MGEFLSMRPGGCAVFEWASRPPALDRTGLGLVPRTAAHEPSHKCDTGWKHDQINDDVQCE